MEANPTAKTPRHTKWLIFTAVVLVGAGLAAWLWSGNWGRENYDNKGLNLSEAPKPDVMPATPTQTSNPSPRSYSNPFVSQSKPGKPAAVSPNVIEPPEWAQAATSFMNLTQQSKYRRSPILRNWAKDFIAYPDLNAIGRKYTRDHDLKFFTVAVLRSTNFAKMLWKYGPSPDVKNFFMDLMSMPSVGKSSRVLVQDPNVMNSIKDLTIPGLPSLGQMMTTGAQGQTPKANNATLQQFMKKQPQ